MGDGLTERCTLFKFFFFFSFTSIDFNHTFQVGITAVRWMDERVSDKSVDGQNRAKRKASRQGFDPESASQ